MFAWGPATRIYLAAGVTDMRKGFEGLYGLVRDRLQCEPLSGRPLTAISIVLTSSRSQSTVRALSRQLTRLHRRNPQRLELWG